MPRLGGANEIVVGQVQDGGHLTKAQRVAVSQSTRGQPCLLSGLFHLQTVFVGAGEEVHVLAIEALKARDGVGCYRLVGVAHVRRSIGIGNRRRNVEFLLPAHSSRFRSC